jgi:hypothetical protein
MIFSDLTVELELSINPDSGGTAFPLPYFVMRYSKQTNMWFMDIWVDKFIKVAHQQ